MKDILAKTNRFIRSYDECRPPKDGGLILIKGRKYFELNDEYKVDDHKVDVSICFYVVGNCSNDKKQSLDITYTCSVEIECCTSEEDSESHMEKLIEYGVRLHSLKEFVNKDEWFFTYDDIEEWFPMINIMRD